MFHGISHIDLPVTNLTRASQFWRDVIGLTETKRGEGFIDLDSGNMAIRLIEVTEVKNPVSLRISVQNLQLAYERILKANTKSAYEPMRTDDLEEIACVTDEDGHSIILWRLLTEDEWDFIPQLPKEGEWYPDAEDLLKRLLSYVPAMFRGLARRKVTRVVEMLAKEDHSAVTRKHVIKGYITSSAKLTRDRLIEPLKKEGINPDDYKEDFDYE